MGNVVNWCKEDEEEEYGTLLMKPMKREGTWRDLKKHPLLFGCSSIEEEKAEIERIMASVKGRHGCDGLSAAGFEYRAEACGKHGGLEEEWIEEEKKLGGVDSASEYDMEHCPDCRTRLYHLTSNTRIEASNRSVFIADGDMYDEVARLCQEVAQDLMQKEAKLRWVTICDDPQHQHELRALLQHDFNEPTRCTKQPTLIIATGRGKVGPGIFSRQHLLTSGIEPSTALPMLREAKARNMRCALIDPNARGDYHTMRTFTKSLSHIFEEDLPTTTTTRSSFLPSPQSPPPLSPQQQHNDQQQIQNNPIYILAHSASGGYLIRHLLTSPQILPRIKAIAFTDSTHNIQWTKDIPDLHAKIQDASSLYLRSNSVRSLGGVEG
eukprot:CAMPEP_0185728682 /NCGR_PEP_ID=MMETSP1171-20130828/4038_1 /TAXON_ID=374046 /ORGANISM="Helicotheca tamensis, Strain CCMP826" /LENGTH=379 /DNA_ID=CAMNT_0028397413 /DNA_START=25 /DNA_END=1161 /DNA_ORIENTATION=-